MKACSLSPAKLPPDQEAIRRRCVHPSSTFVRFEPNDREQSIPDRFQRIVRDYPELIAIQSTNEAVTFDQLNRLANAVAGEILKRSADNTETIGLLIEQGCAAISGILGRLVR